MSTTIDLDTAVELAPRVWWVGALLPGDRFQCHVYLVEQGDQSVLIDPGSALTAAAVIDKVDSVVGLDHVRWVVCSHQDPDILGALPAFEAHGLHPDAAIVTHWRDEALIVHAGTKLPFWRIEDHEWRLPLEDRALQFIFTPYVHFAGAFCTFDDRSGTLFSSDLFGGFSSERSLIATSEAYFEAMRSFHEHYMPSREVLVSALDRLRELPLRMIAPQHGQIIPERLIVPIMDQLAGLECGIYLLARDDPGLRFLLTANRTLRDIVDTLVEETRFGAVASHLADLAATYLHAETLEVWAPVGQQMLLFDASDAFAGRIATPPDDVAETIRDATPRSAPEPERAPKRLLVPVLAGGGTPRTVGVAVLSFHDGALVERPQRALLDQIAALVHVPLEREVWERAAAMDRDVLYERAIHDPLTGLHNRLYLTDVANRLVAMDDRDGPGCLAAVLLDVDHFEHVNDEHGHDVGDRVLQHVARAIAGGIRPGDVAVRYGGEEFLVLLSNVDEDEAWRVSERIRARVTVGARSRPTVTVSGGIALRHRHEDHTTLIARADVALYEAKAAGRNRSRMAREPHAAGVAAPR